MSGSGQLYYALFRKDDERPAICQTKKLIRDILDERRTRCAPDLIAADGTPLARAFTQPLPTSWEAEGDASDEAVLSAAAIAWQE